MFPPNADVLVKANPHSHAEPIKPTGESNASRFGRPIYKYSTPAGTTNGIPNNPSAAPLSTPTSVAPNFLGNYTKKKNQTYQSNQSNQGGRRRFNNANNSNNNTGNTNNNNITFIPHHPKKASLDLTSQPPPTVHQFVPQTYANLFADQQAHFAHFSQHLVMSSIASAPNSALKSQLNHTASQNNHHSSPPVSASGNGTNSNNTTPSSDTITTTTTSSSSAATSVAPPASSYSLDFLHYVGVQMTNGGHGLIQPASAADQLHSGNHRSVIVNTNGSGNTTIMQKHPSFFGPNGRSYDKSVQLSPTSAAVAHVPSIGYYQQHQQSSVSPQQLKSPTAFYHMGHQQFQHAIGQHQQQQHALVVAAQQQHQHQQQQQQQHQQHQQTQTVAYHMNNNNNNNNNNYNINNRNIQMGNGNKKSWYNNYPKNKKFLTQNNHQHNQHQSINCNNNNNNNSTTINNNFSTNMNGANNHNSSYSNNLNNNNNNNNININNSSNNINSSNTYNVVHNNRNKDVPDISSLTAFPIHSSQNGNNTTISCTAKTAPRTPKSVTPPITLHGSTSSISSSISAKQLSQPPPPTPPCVSPHLTLASVSSSTDSNGSKAYRSNSTPVEYDSDSSHSSYTHRTNSDGQHYKSCSSSIGSDSTTQSSSDQSVGVNHGGIGYYGVGSQAHEQTALWSTAAMQGYNGGGGYQYSSIGALDANKELGRIGQRDHYMNDNGQQPQQKRSYSGRNSPQINRGRRIHTNHFIGHRVGSENHMYTPPDKYLNRSHLVEQKTPPDALLNGSKYDSLSQMIWDRWCSAQQTEETYKKKMYLWRYLYVCVKKTFPRYSLYLVGSTMSGFGSETSDVDMCLVSRFITDMEPRVEAVLHLTHLQEHLISNTVIFDSFNLIQAKVPILRFKDSLHLLEVDLNFNNCVGIRNTHLLYCYSQMDWRLRPLVLVVKLWAQFHNINNAKDMTISSYSLVLMTIHFLQFAVTPAVLPCLHTMYPLKFQTVHDINMIDMNEDLEPYYSENTQSLAELFLKFLEYYSSFSYSHYAISVRTACLLTVEECRLARSPKNDPHQWKELCIEEPFDLTNTARSVYDNVIFEQIKGVFVRSCRTLHETMDLNSLFDQPFMLPTSNSPLGSGGGVGGHLLANMVAAASAAAPATNITATTSSSATDASTSSISSVSSSADTSS